jgi:hypothetical protein
VSQGLQIGGTGGAPIGHLQPRARQLAPESTAEQAQQGEMSNFDAEQQKLDEQLDKHLNICRGADAYGEWRITL